MSSRRTAVGHLKTRRNVAAQRCNKWPTERQSQRPHHKRPPLLHFHSTDLFCLPAGDNYACLSMAYVRERAWITDVSSEDTWLHIDCYRFCITRRQFYVLCDCLLPRTTGIREHETALCQKSLLFAACTRVKVTDANMSNYAISIPRSVWVNPGFAFIRFSLIFLGDMRTVLVAP